MRTSLILLLASALLLAIDASPIDEVDGNASARKPGRLPLRKLLGRRKLLTEEEEKRANKLGGCFVEYNEKTGRKKEKITRVDEEKLDRKSKGVINQQIIEANRRSRSGTKAMFDDERRERRKEIKALRDGLLQRNASDGRNATDSEDIFEDSANEEEQCAPSENVRPLRKTVPLPKRRGGNRGGNQGNSGQAESPGNSGQAGSPGNSGQADRPVYGGMAPPPPPPPEVAEETEEDPSEALRRKLLFYTARRLVAGSLARLLEEDVESTGSPPPPSPPSDDASGDPQGPGQGSGGGRGRGQCLDKLIDEEDEELREWDEALLEEDDDVFQEVEQDDEEAAADFADGLGDLDADEFEDIEDEDGEVDGEGNPSRRLLGDNDASRARRSRHKFKCTKDSAGKLVEWQGNHTFDTPVTESCSGGVPIYSGLDKISPLRFDSTGLAKVVNPGVEYSLKIALGIQKLIANKKKAGCEALSAFGVVKAPLGVGVITKPGKVGCFIAQKILIGTMSASEKLLMVYSTYKEWVKKANIDFALAQQQETNFNQFQASEAIRGDVRAMACLASKNTQTQTKEITEILQDMLATIVDEIRGSLSAVVKTQCEIKNDIANVQDEVNFIRAMVLTPSGKRPRWDGNQKKWVSPNGGPGRAEEMEWCEPHPPNYCDGNCSGAEAFINEPAATIRECALSTGNTPNDDGTWQCNARAGPIYSNPTIRGRKVNVADFQDNTKLECNGCDGPIPGCDDLDLGPADRLGN